MFRVKPQSVADRSSDETSRSRWFAALLLLFCASVIAPAQSSVQFRGLSSQKEAVALKKRAFEPALKILQHERIKFDPKLLLDDDWRAKIAPGLANIPEMKAIVQVGEQMGGVYFAGTLLLPERVTLTGDTVILAHELVPTDEDSLINITGPYGLFIFVIGDTKQYQAMRRRTTSDFLRFNVGGACVFVGIRVFHSRFTCRGGSAFDAP